MSHDEPTPQSRPTEPATPELPTYVIDAVERQTPDRLDIIAEYASDLAEYKRRKRAFEAEQKRQNESVDTEALEEIDASVDTEDYDDVPSGAYVTVKETKPGYRYYYWQWREGDSWKNEYIAPVNPKE